LKKSLFAILIALVMIVALIPVLASADSEPETVKFIIGNQQPEVTRGGTPKYYLTDNTAGTLTSTGADENNYNVKVVYEEDATPVIYLKGAFIYGQYGSIRNTSSSSPDVVPAEKRASKTTIVIEEAGDSITVRDGTVAADACLDGVITWVSGALEIQGPGKLVTNKTINAGSANDLTFTNADVEINAVDDNAGLGAKNITFDGGKFVSNTTNKPTISDWGTTERRIWIKGNAEVSMTASAESPMVLANANATVQIDSGSLKLKSTSSGTSEHVALRMSSDADFIVNGGTVELSGAGRILYSNRTFDMTNYGTYYAAYGTNANGPGTTVLAGTTITKNADYSTKYLKIEPAYTVAVTGGTASSATAPAGTEVTLTSGTAPTGKIFDGWTSSDVTVTNNKFTMPAKNVTVAANFIDDPNNDGEPATVGFWFGTSKQMINRGASPIYLITNDSGAATTTGATADNYNIMLSYENGKTPVIKLRGAYLKNHYGALHNNNQSSGNLTDNERASKVTIIVEDELGNATSNIPSTVTADAYIVSYILLSKGDVEIQGPGKLVVDKFQPNSGNAVAGNIQTGKNLTFKDADVEVRQGALKASGNITFDGGKVAITHNDIIVVDYNTSTRTILVTNDADVSLNSTEKATMHLVNANATLQIDSGSLKLTSSATGTDTEKAALKMSGAKLKLNGGTLEIAGNVTVVTSSIEMDLTNYEHYYAVCANNVEGNNAVPHTGTAIAQYNTSFNLKYFKLVPAKAITVTGGTANPAAAPEGVVVTLTPVVPQGKEFVKWNVDSGSTAVTISNNKFTMPNGPVSITAEFKDATSDGGNTPAGHTHSTTLVKGKAPSCTAAGEKDYYKCSCGKYFEDKAATKEIKDLKTWKVIKATGHKDADKDGKCEVCNKSAQTSDSSFTALWITVLTLSAMGICVTFVYNKRMRVTK